MRRCGICFWGANSTGHRMTGSPGWRGVEGTETGFSRTTTRLLRSGMTVTMRSVMAVDGATITSERRAARCTTTALRRTEAR